MEVIGDTQENIYDGRVYDGSQERRLCMDSGADFKAH